MELLAALLALLVALVLLVLLVPIRLAAHGALSVAGADGSASASWGAGLLSVRASAPGGVSLNLVGRPVYHFKRRPSEERARKRAQRTRKKRRGSPGPRFILPFVRRMLASLRLRARLLGRLGTGDPADTARLFGALVALRQVLPGLDTRAVHIDWMEPAFDLEGQVEGRVWPAAIAWIAASEYARTRRMFAA